MAIIEFMSGDHKRCDQLFADAEAAVDSGNWDDARTSVNQFIDSTEEHFSMEEDVLYKASGRQRTCVKDAELLLLIYFL